MKEKIKYTLVGSGRLARHLEHYLRFLGIPFIKWSRREPPERFAEALRDSSHVLLAVKDQAIGPIAERVRSLVTSHELEEKWLVHFSGALEVSGVHAAHPLMTFAEPLQSRDWYERIPFAIEKGQTLTALLPGFPNPSFELRREDRAKYHAMVSMAGNFAYLLWRETFAELERLGVPSSALTPYLQQVLHNFADDPRHALTGPLARKDWSTIDLHLSALRDRLAWVDLYKAFIRLAEGDLK